MHNAHPTVIDALRRCAKIIVEGNSDAIVDLSFFRSFRAPEILEVLDREVRELTDGQRVVLRADAALFAHHLKGPVLYLVACSPEVRSFPVREVTEDMTFFTIGPYYHGLYVNPKLASPQEVESYRQAVAAAQQVHNRRQAAQLEAEHFLAMLKAEIDRRIALCNDPQLRTELESFIGSRRELRLEEISDVCLRLDTTLIDLVRCVLR